MHRFLAWPACCLALAVIVFISIEGQAASEKAQNKTPPLYQGLPLRLLGPAYPSGRISDFAVDPERHHRYYVATASGGLWLTENNGLSWNPIFDDAKSYSIGVVELDPKNSQTVWLGSGENNAQRSVAWGDGVYKSYDGGKRWKNVGLQNSGHIGSIAIDPRDSNTVFVAAHGPLWSPGGDRGVYKTEDGGVSWKRVLEIDENTGANEVLQHPERPDHLLAAAYQRRRHVWVLINGGPGSGIHKSTDGGRTWNEITAGLPKVDMGKIGLAYAPSRPDRVYAIIEAATVDGTPKTKKKTGPGVYRSDDFGETWKKVSDHMTTSPQYYNELVVDPHNPDRVYSLDTFTHVSTDGGKTWQKLSIAHKHVDDHALWINPDHPGHLRMGSDGGIYESFDHGQSWGHIHNLPITQFYRVAVDNESPFYNVCGGTQDNNSLCAPSQTTFVEGILNEDWTIILGGDGYEPQIDPTDPNIIYTQFQYGGLARYDRTTGEKVYIAPQPGPGEPELRWNWNTPLLISPHNPQRLYYGAQKLFRSDDRGSSWTPISPDLSRGLDRNKLKVMGRVWGIDTVAKNNSTSFYGSLIAVSESPKQADLLYAGTDDGLIHISENGGGRWRVVKRIGDAPEMTYVEDIDASVHDADVVYAVLDNHKRGDFKPYVFRSTDRGRSWRSIAGNLPRGPAHALVEDPKSPQVLFVGTEFGLFVTQDQGRTWHPLKGGFPTIDVRDVTIQPREEDLIVATFGRGIYILDDITPLRTPSDQLKGKEATLFPVKNPWLYVPRSQFGGEPKGSRGVNYWQANNPPFGAVFTYFLREGVFTQRQQRRKLEQAEKAKGLDTPYPSWERVRQEDREEAPTMVLTISDADGRVVRRVQGPVTAGFHRVAWDLRYAAPDPIDLTPADFRPPWVDPPKGPLVTPGTYQVQLSKRVAGTSVALGAPQSFTVKALDQNSPLVTDDRQALLAFQQQTAELYRSVQGAVKTVGEMKKRVAHLKVAVDATVAAGPSFGERVRDVERQVLDLEVVLTGDKSKRQRNEPVPWSIQSRVGSIVWGHWESQSAVTGTHQRAFDIAASEYEVALKKLYRVHAFLAALEGQLEQNAAPWTPGRLPTWQRPQAAPASSAARSGP